MGQDLIEELKSLIQSYHKYSEEEFDLKAHALINSLKTAIDNQNTLLKKYSIERNAIILRMNKALESEKNAYERLADLDISRHVAISDLRHALAEKENLLKDSPADRLTKELEVKKLQLEEAESNLSRLAQTMRELEAKYKDLDNAYRESEKENQSLKEKAEPAQWQKDSHTDDDRKALSLKMTELEEALKEKDSENTSLRDSISEMNSLLENKGKELEAFASEKSGLMERLSQALIEIDQYKSETERLVRETEELKDKRIEAGELKEQNKELLSGLKKLSQENNELSSKLSEAQRGYVSLKEDQQGLLSEIKAELEALKVKGNEENSIVSDELKTVSSKMHELTERLESNAINNTRLGEMLEEISIKTRELFYPVISERQDAHKKEPLKARTVNLKRIILTACAALLTIGVITGSIYAFKKEWLGFLGTYLNLPVKEAVSPSSKMPVLSQPPAMPVDIPKKEIVAPWSGLREVSYKNFKATITFLSPDLMDSHGVSSKVLGTEKAENYFYMLELTAHKDCIPEDIINSPHEKISFIKQNGSLLKATSLPNLEAAKKAVYKVNACRGKTGPVHFRYFMAINKTENIKGAVIEDLIKGAPLIIK